MAQGVPGINVFQGALQYGDSPNIDAFSRLRTSNPQAIFDAQLTYDLQPLLFEPITNGSGASIAHDTTNRVALMTFSSTPTGGKAYLQSFEYFRYQPGKSQEVAMTFRMVAGVANVLKFVGYSDGVNGIEFQLDGTTKQFVIYSSSSLGSQTITQGNWNLDNLDGTGGSGITLDISKEQILIIDFQALYVGRVRVGFDIGGVIVYAHEFLHANLTEYPYVANANLPVRCGMTCTGTVSTTMTYTCNSVMSEGGQENLQGFDMTQEGTATAGSGTRTHILSIRPALTFASIPNRTKFIMAQVKGLVTGNNPILWELVLGQAISGTTAFNVVNATYSSYEYNTAGTISGSPAIVIDSGYIAPTAVSSQSIISNIANRYPITLDQAGAVRSLGTVSLLVTGIGGTSACRMSLGWKEIR